MNTYYTIANVERQCYGYGDFGSEEVIKRAGPWGSGDFPPLFKSRTDVEAWLRGATEHAGSWWPEWQKWVAKLSGDKLPARQPGDGKLTPIEDAPGAYVKVRQQ